MHEIDVLSTISEIQNGTELSKEEAEKLARALAEQLTNPILTPEDITRVLELLSVVSPDYCAPMIEDVLAHVPIVIGDASAAMRSAAQFANRSSTYATQISIERGTRVSPRMLIHEIKHALPVQDSKLLMDLDATDSQLEKNLHAQLMRDEAHSYLAELQLSKELAKFGVEISLGSDEYLPQVAAAYESGGFEGLVEQMPVISPFHDQYYKQQSGNIVRQLRNKELISIPEIGLSVTDNGGIQIKLDTGKLLKSVSDPVFQGKIVGLAQEYLSQILQNLQRKNSPRDVDEDEIEEEDTAGGTAEKTVEISKESLLALTFENRPEPTNKLRERIVADKEATRLKIRLTGEFAKRLHAGRKRDASSGSYFSERLLFAEKSFGAAAAKLYKELVADVLEVAKTKSRYEDYSKKLFDVGASMMRAGYSEQGITVIKYYIERHGVRGASIGDLQQLSEKLIQVGLVDLAKQLLPEIEKKLSQNESKIKKVLLRRYVEAYNGRFTIEGRKKVEELFDNRKQEGKRVSTSELYALVVQLRANEEYVLAPNADYVINKVSQSEELEVYLELTRVSPLDAVSISKLSRAVHALDQELSKRYEELASSIFSQATEYAKIATELQLAVLAEGFKVAYDKNLGPFPFLLYVSSENKEYEYFKVFSEPYVSVLTNLFNDPPNFSKGLQLLYTMENIPEKCSMFELAAEKMPDTISDADVEHFVAEWKSSALQTAKSLAKYECIENSERYSDRVRQMKEYDYSRPTSFADLHLVLEQQKKQAVFDLRQKNNQKAYERGIQTLLDLAESRKPFFNPHYFKSSTTHLYDEKYPWSSYRRIHFEQLPFKIGALATAIPLANPGDVRLQETIMRNVESLELEPNNNYSDAEYKTIVLMEALDALVAVGNIPDALIVYRRATKEVERLVHTAQRKIDTFTADQKLQYGSRHKDDLQSNLKNALFWQQYFDSVLKTKLLLSLRKQDKTAVSDQILDEVTSSFLADVQGRRGRFDTRSVIKTARLVCEAEGLVETGYELFKIATAKLVLERGGENSSVFTDGTKYLYKSIRHSPLSDAQKDQLLSELVIAMTPPENKDWTYFSGSFVTLLTMANEIASDRRFAKTELEILKIFASIQDELITSSNFTLMSNMFDYLTKYYPEFLYDSNFDCLQSCVDDSQHFSFIAALLPATAETVLQGPIVVDGFFDLNRIRAGYFDMQETLDAVLSELTRVLSNPELVTTRLVHLLQVLTEISSQEMVAFRNTKTSEFIFTKQDLLNLQSIGALHGALEKLLYSSGAQFSAEAEQLLRVFLQAGSAEEAAMKYPLYLDLLGNTAVPTLVQQVVFENLAKTDKVTSYVDNYFSTSVRASGDSEQRQFYEWMKKLLILCSDTLPNDHMVAFLLKNPHRAGEFFQKFEFAVTHDVVPWQIENVHRYPDSGLHIYYKGSKEQFFELRDFFITKGTFWLPSLTNDLDLLITYDTNFDSNGEHRSYEKFLENIEEMYVKSNWNMDVPSYSFYSYTVEDLEEELQKYLPNFVFTEAQFQKVEDIFWRNKQEGRFKKESKVPWNKGGITYSQLTTEVTGEINLGTTQYHSLIRFLKGPDTSDAILLLRIYGDIDQPTEKKQEISDTLHQARLEYISRVDAIQEGNIETPAVFEKMPEVVQFMMKQYFMLLPYGERRAILDEFEVNQTLPPEKAVQRFFEVTGMEKVGQFLSTRRDLIPENYRVELEQFQEDVEASSFEEVRKTVELQLGKPLTEVFGSFETTALKVGTIGEVYAATLLDGTAVVVKVITPSKRQVVRRTLDRIGKVCWLMQRNKDRFGGTYDPIAMFTEFKTSMEEELDFRKERENAEAMRKDLPQGFTIPSYHPGLSGESVLVQSFASGVNVREIVDSTLKKDVVVKLGSLLIRQIISHGVFHDDLHPGNVRVNPLTGEIELLDFGRTGYAAERERNSLVPLILAITTKSTKHIVDILVDTSASQARFDRIGLEHKLEQLLPEFSGRTSLMISSILFECGNHGLEVNPTYMRILKAVMTFEGTALMLQPDFSFDTFFLQYGMSVFQGSMGALFNTPS